MALTAVEISRRRWVVALVALAIIAGLAWAGYRRIEAPAPDRSLQRVRAAGQLVVGLDPSYPPFEVVNGAGEIVGFDADLARELARRLGVRVRFVSVDFGSIYDALEQHQFDVMLGGVTPSPDDLRQLDYSVPYYDNGLVLVTNRRAGGNVIGIESGSDADLALDRLKTTLKSFQFQPFDDQDQIHDQLARGQIKGTVVDAATGASWAHQNPDLVAPPDRLAPNPFVLAARRDDAALLRALDAELVDLGRTGYLAGLQQTWLK